LKDIYKKNVFLWVFFFVKSKTLTFFMKYLYVLIILLAGYRPILAQDTTISKAKYTELMLMQQNLAAQNNMLKKDLSFLKKAIWEAQITLQLAREFNGFSPNQDLLTDTTVARLLYRIQLEEAEARDSNFYAKTSQDEAKMKEMQLYYSRLVQKIMSGARAHRNPKIAALLAKEAYVFYLLYPSIYTRAGIYDMLLDVHFRLDSSFNTAILPLEQSDKRPKALSFHAGGKNEIYSRYADGQAYLWSGLAQFAAEPKSVFLPKLDNTLAIATQYDGSIVAARLNSAKKLEVWQTKNGLDTVLYAEKSAEKQAKITAVALAQHSDFGLIARGADYFLQHWASRQSVALAQDVPQNTQVIWSSDEKYAVFFEPKSQFLQIWSLPKAQRDTAWENKIARLRQAQKLPMTAIAATSSHWLIGYQDGTLCYWAQQEPATMPNTWKVQAREIDEIALSPNAAFAALRTTKDSIQLLELPSSSPNSTTLVRYKIFAPDNSEFLFSSNSRQIYTIDSKKNQVWVWATDMFDYAKQICNCTQGNLDDATWLKYIGTDTPNSPTPYIKMPDNRKRTPSSTCPNTSNIIINNED
jgi:hypothetical protein